MSVGRLNGSRRYESPRRREQAAQTRAAIADAARRRFLEVGWAATRVRDVAADAGVAESTVFAAYGSKSGLAMAVVDAMDHEEGLAPSVGDVQAASTQPREQLAVMVAADRALFERHHHMIRLLRDAEGSEPDLRAAYDSGRARADQVRRSVFGDWPIDVFRAGVDADTATTTFAALCNVEVYLVLTTEHGLTPDGVERWWHDSTTTLILR